MNIRYPNSLLLGLSLLTYQAATYSWGATGHMLTAQIAQDNLQPQTLQIVNKKLAYPLQFPQLSLLTKKDNAPGKLAKKLNTIVLEQGKNIRRLRDHDQVGFSPGSPIPNRMTQQVILVTCASATAVNNETLARLNEGRLPILLILAEKSGYRNIERSRKRLQRCQRR